MRTFPALLLSLAVCAWSQATRDGAFVRDGRSLAWRLVVPTGLDTTKPNPVYLHLHGNNTGTAQEMLEMFWYGAWAHVRKRGGIGVVLGSPEVCNEGSKVRCWFYEKDGPLLLEALRTGFDGAFRIDTTKVVLHGGSQGSCFLDDFLQTQRFGMSGGAFLDCGCHSSRFDRIPDTTWARKFRVFVSSTTGDFLHEDGFAAADHFRWWSRLPTRASLRNTGGHCATPPQVTDSALDWLTGRIEIPEAAFEPHWERVAPFEGIEGVVVTPRGAIYLSQTARDTSHVWRSLDGGGSWSRVWTAPDSVYTWTWDTSTYTSRLGLGGLAVQGEGVVVSHLRVLHLLRPDGSRRQFPSPGVEVFLHRRVGSGPWEKRPWPSADGLVADTTQWPSALEVGLDGRLLVLGTPSFQEQADGSWKRLPGGWFDFSRDAGAFVPDGRILRVAGIDGLMAWVPRPDLSVWSPTSVGPRGASRAATNTRRDGVHLVLPSGGTWNVRWLDARGRTIFANTLPGASRVEARPAGTVLGPQWIEVSGPSVREIFPVLR